MGHIPQISVLFTYKGDYYSNDVVRFNRNVIDDFSDISGTYTLGPYTAGSFVITSGWGTGSGGTFFEDADRIVDIDAQTYGVFADFANNSGPVNLTGGVYGDVLFGGSGNDLLSGGGGNDVFSGGSGEDTIDGGTGSDTVSYDSMDNGVSVDLSAATGTDRQTSEVDTLSRIENIRGTAYADILAGDSGNNVIEGGDGDDTLIGGDGNDTVSYEHSTAATFVDLTVNLASTANGLGVDSLDGFENVRGTAYADTLIGNADANTLTGMGGADTLRGLAGNDRLVITESPTRVDGGDNIDMLFVQGGGTIVLTDSNFIDIEKTYVRNGTTLDMSGVGADGDTIGSTIISQSTAGSSVSITGSADRDYIIAGKGGDTLDGGAGADKLFGGAGADTFHFEVDSGRDNLYRFTAGIDIIDLSAFADSYDDFKVTAINNGQNALITFVGDSDPSHKIIVHDVQKAALTDASFLIAPV